MAEKTNADTAKTPDRVVIKKYANRRLYNTARSSYVTLDDLAEMVRKGEDFAVFDAKSGDDITRSVLTQIIVEEEGREQNMLPTNFLRALIRLYGDPLQGVVPAYLDAAMQTFSRNQDRMRTAFGGASAFDGFEAMTRANMDLLEKSMRMFSPFGAKTMDRDAPPDPQPGPAPETEASSTVSDDLEALQRQVRAMQEQLEKISKSG